ncbi:AAA family ATPase [Thermobifida halotolerans]|uniref:AAA family ATPase n=1 Tax=Thermobifida halotolerans TaxID=483545 RepID=A0A399G400_9ACTN|nr:AAA family ATPase [Thermobifida halotolerans]UOE19484.1 AAA family ATPase [Thermobifida halotolerans]
MYVAELAVSGIRGFHGARSAELRLTRPDGGHAGWTVLAGPNGAGKTTLLRALALALVGPTVGRGLVSDFRGWLSRGETDGRVRALVRPDPDWDRGSRGRDVLREPFEAELYWSDFGGARPQFLIEPDRTVLLENGPWTEEPRGWFVVGYGPFRRPDGGWPRSGRPVPVPGSVSRLADLFGADSSLAEGLRWLTGVHLGWREGFAELPGFVLSLLDDGLLPDGFRVVRLDGDGLWVARGGEEFPLGELGDGHRVVVALVADLVRHAFEVFGPGMVGEHGGSPAVVCPGVVLVDEVEAHLHAGWQRTIGDWLKRHFPRVQFVVSTHSPHICRSADPGGLIHLPGVDEDEPPRVVSEDLYERVVYGSGDDALLTELFGTDSPYSERAEEKRRRLARLESAVLRGTAVPEEVSEYERLRKTLTSSLTARVDEVAGRINRT